MLYNNLFLILIFLIAISCKNEEQDNEKWQVSRWEAAILCTFPHVESEHPIVEALLGLDDSTERRTELLLQNNGNFVVIKNGEVILVGDWSNHHQKLYLNTINEQWFFDVLIKNKDSLVLKSETTITLADLYLTLKK